MRSLLILLVFGVFGCQEEAPALKFRTPEEAALNTPASAPQSTSMLVLAPKTEPTSASQPSAPFSCELDGKPWLLASDQKLQGLLLQRPGLSKEQPPTKLITIALQGASKERLLLEITADTPTLEAVKLTLTTKDTVAKANTSLKEVEQHEDSDGLHLSLSLEAELQTLGSAKTRTLKSCRLQGVLIRSLQAETAAVEE